ncbi:MAG: UDP-N-acetylmuramyl-tripeptide synthetase [Clostridia bacterium]|nr:UDP-N-acetylmuramyl-tripeptide synthetase [Clostridia bacterium]
MLQYKNRVITGVTHDSRKVVPGNVFVAVRGLTTDGHDYIQQAVANGAELIICEQDPLIEGIPYIKIKDSRAALAILARNFYNRPDLDLITMGITGTNGKTTITTLLNHIFNENDISCGLIGSNGVSYTDQYWDAILTTPDAVNLYYYLHQMVEERVKVVAMEVSSHSLKQKRVEGMQFNLALFTNLSLDHLDLHGTYQDYLDTKLLLGKKLKPGGLIVYNKDDVIAGEIENSFRQPKISYGIKVKSADIKGYLTKTTREGSEMEVRVNSSYLPYIGTFNISSGLLGEHNASNLLAAICCALSFGLSPQEIAAAIVSFRGVKRRLEIIYNEKFTIVDDFCHNPANYEAVLRTVAVLPSNKIFLVTPVRGNRGELVNSENAKVIARWGKKLNLLKIIVTNSEDTVHPKDRVKGDEEIAFLKPLWQAGLNVSHTPTLTQGLELVLDEVEAGDLVLLLGSHPFKSVGEKILKMTAQHNIFMGTGQIRQENQWQKTKQ